MNLNKRIPTAIVLLGFVFLCIQYLPRLGFFIILQCFIIAALLELFALTKKNKIKTHTLLGIVLSLILGVSFIIDRLPLEIALFAVLFVSGVYFVFYINTLDKMSAFPSSISTAVFAAVYLGFTLNFFYPLRNEYGPLSIYFFLAIIFLGDTGAYIVGKLIGRHKMSPIASPRKTWEGSFGGILTACLGALAARVLFIPDILIWKAILMAFFVHAAAQFSDPLESLFKRAVGVKDSSNLLPGHGGFLDRVDSLVFATPLFYFLMKYFGAS